MSAIDTAIMLGWKPDEPIPQSQLEESARLWLRSRNAAFVEVGAEAPRTDEVLIVKGPHFFSKRDADDKVLMEPSDATIDAVLQRFKSIILFSATESSRPIATYVKKRYAPTIVVEVDTNSIMLSIGRMVEAFHAVGITVHRPHNIREISWLNIEKFVSDKRAVIVSASGHADIGLTPEKEPDMQEMMRRRQRANEWG